MTVKTNNVQNGGWGVDAVVRWMNNEPKPLYDSVKKRINNKVALYDYLTDFIEQFPCFPDLEDVTPMTTYKNDYFIKSGNDLLYDINVAIQYAKCKNCEDEYKSCNYQDCTLRDNKCHIDQFCSHTYGTTTLCFLKKHKLSFDEYQLAWHFDILSNEGDGNYTNKNVMYLHKKNYPDLVRRIGWKYHANILPDDFDLLQDEYKTSDRYMMWKDLYKLLITDSKSRYGGKKSRKSRNKKRKSNKKKRKTVKKRRLRKQK